MKKAAIILLIFCSTGLVSFFTGIKAAPKDKIKTYYSTAFQYLLQELAVLQTAVETDENDKAIRQGFLQARLAYKRLEPILEYYFEGDVKHFNGLSVQFIEEEDPMAYQEPQGFQMIETFIFPQYNRQQKKDLLLYIYKLAGVAKGLGKNPALFDPEEYMPDAVMEELYRILALGISGFDSPLAKYSIPEAGAALKSIRFIMQAYKDEWQPLQPGHYNTAISLLDRAANWLHNHHNFNGFNRMEFILSFLNPLCDAIGAIKLKAGNKENDLHYCLIKKTGSLFNANSLDLNRYLYNDKISTVRAALGKKLFYEPLLSLNNKRSCAACHQPGKAFTDGLPKALQIDEHGVLPRNTPGLWNAALQINLFYDSRHTRLEDVVLEVLGNKKEMNSGAIESVKNLQYATEYKKLFRDAYGEAGGGLTEKNMANAIAMYIRTLVSYNSRFDKYMRGEKDKMKTAEIKGFNLFMGKAKCATCHYVPLFNGSKPPAYYYQESEVIGVPAGTDTVHPVLDTDPGRMYTLKFNFFNHAFKTPTLRNIALTAPYMHNGVYKTLEEVIDFYDKGGGQGLGLSVPNQTLPADKLQLTKTEKKQLKAFLLTLTDTTGMQ